MPRYYFNLPQINALTPDQQAALNEPRPIALSGGPGTGKSVVSLWRHIANFQNTPQKKSLLLTYTTTLKEYLKSCCRSQSNEAANCVSTSLRNRNRIHNFSFAEVIIDEAQDLGNDFYNDISSSVSYGADDSQIVYPEHCSTEAQLRSIFPNNVEYTLSRNFRSTQRIMLFARSCFPNAVIPREIINSLSNNIGELPVLMFSGGNPYDYTNKKQNDAIYEIINEFHSDTHNIAILVPFRGDVRAFENVLEGLGYTLGEDYSVYYEDTERFPNGAEEILNIHITTFKSAKGLEFDTVIIPNFDKMNSICGNYNVEWKDYYVACTRARSNLYIISNTTLPNLNNVVDLAIL